MSRAAALLRALALCAAWAGALGAAWALGAGRATAAEWTVDAAASSLQVDYSINGVGGAASFTRFEGEGWLDPTRPEDAELVLDFEIAAMDFGNPLATAFAMGPDWFASAEFPDGRFRLSRLRRDGADGFVAEGALTLKGVTRPLRVPLTLRLEGAVAHASGRLLIEPLAFGIGDGPTAALVSMGRRATVIFDLVARSPATAD